MSKTIIRSVLTTCLLLCSVAAFSWAPSVRIRNNSGCAFRVYLVYTNETQPPYSCNGVYTQELVIAPFSNIIYDNTTVTPPGSPLGARNFLGASISNGPLSCIVGPYQRVGNPCLNWPASATIIMLGGASCTTCATVTATWSDNPSGTPSSTLTIN